jgi:hypothetical protein
MAKKPRPAEEIFTSVKWNVDLKTPDEWQADYFLWGHTPPTLGLFRREYPQKGEDERLAREALVRVLRNPKPLSRTLRDRLAELFDAQSKLAERQLVFKRRSGRPKSRSNKQVANYVHRKTKESGKKEAAVAEAMEKFKLSRKQVFQKLKG